MAKISRWTQKIFASSAVNNGVFGSAQANGGAGTVSNSLTTIQSLTAFATGWLGATIGANKFPPLEEFQALDYMITTQLAYLFQEGVPEYDASTTYYQYSIVKKTGTFQLWGSMVDNNVGNALTNGANWKLLTDLSATTFYAGGTSTGSANAQAVATTSGNFTLTAGYAVSWNAGYANTTAMTLAVDGTAAKTVKKNGASGLVDLVSGDIIAGEEFLVIYNGTYFVVIDGCVPNVIVPVGCCRLNYVSSTQIKLIPYKGNKLMINGAIQTIPSAGTTLANTGLTAATLYYIYAYMNGATLTLEASATTHATDTTTGVEIKSGDATRTLVGMVYMGAGSPGVFQTGALTLSYFNRTRMMSKATLGSVASVSSLTSWTLVAGSQVYFLTWGDEITHVEYSGTHYVTAGSGVTIQSQVAVDATNAVYPGASPQGAGQPSFSHLSSFYSDADAALTEGVHYVCGCIQAYAGTGVTGVSMQGNFAAAITQG